MVLADASEKALEEGLAQVVKRFGTPGAVIILPSTTRGDVGKQNCWAMLCAKLVKPFLADQPVAKGRTAAETRRSSMTWQERIKSRPELMGMPDITPVQGGLPIMVEGVCLGGVGVSGVQSHEDEQIAQAGIDAVLKA